MTNDALVTSGLQYPRSPIWTEQGLLVVVEAARGTLSAIAPSGEIRVLAELGGTPMAAAVGPDERIYVCNNGGVAWSEVDGLALPGGQADTYTGGRIQRVDPFTGDVEVLYDEVDGIRLRAPHDLVFDQDGGFWFVDIGHIRPRQRDRGGLYYAQADGSAIREVVYPLDAPGGVALDPDGDTLYVTESQQGRVYQWALSGPGQVAGHFAAHHPGQLLADPENGPIFGSVAVDRLGNLCVATMRTGGVTVVTTDGIHRFEPLDDPLVTSVAFGGPNYETLFAAYSGQGVIVARPWDIRGLRPSYVLTSGLS
jgi:gluconolactonase